MLEQLVGYTGDAFPRIAISGPGPQELISYEKGIGYFGEVNGSEFVTPSELSQYLEFGNGADINPSTQWLKFYRDRKVLFVSKLPIKKAMSWEDVDVVGAVDGKSAIQIDGLWFRIRLLEGIDSGYQGEEDLSNDSIITHDSEWNDLMYIVTVNNTSYPKGSQKGPNVRNFSYNELGLGNIDASNTLTLNKGIDDSGTVYARGRPGVTSISKVSREARDNTLGWRVCLELDLDSLIAPWLYPVGGNAFIDTLTIEQLYQAPKDLDCEFLYIPPRFELVE